MLGMVFRKLLFRHHSLLVKFPFPKRAYSSLSASRVTKLLSANTELNDVKPTVWTHDVSAYAFAKRNPGHSIIDLHFFHISSVALDEVKIVNVPAFAESVSEGDVRWEKAVGDSVAEDEVICEIETDKMAIQVHAPATGVIEELLVGDGASVQAGAKLFKLHINGEAPKKAEAVSPEIKEKPVEPKKEVAPPPPPPHGKEELHLRSPDFLKPPPPPPPPPAGGGRPPPPSTPSLPKGPRETITAAQFQAQPALATSTWMMNSFVIEGTRMEQCIKMNHMRLRISQRLKDAQNVHAMLTTFNEIDMRERLKAKANLDCLAGQVLATSLLAVSGLVITVTTWNAYTEHPACAKSEGVAVMFDRNVMELRKTHQETFVKKYGMKMGFMAAFIKASAYALKNQPVVNAIIDGNKIVYRDYIDISGLVVPVLQNVEVMNFADMELGVAALAEKAQKGELAIEDMDGGTFTISNRGVFGSLMMTPIINPPQSAILGMHVIFDRPVARNNQACPLLFSTFLVL
ncbi:unnamed protein product [Darwinula stevensoni]|uniref:Dihydrolipoamide acetyltransferase component of pyruvate dehydrogenase complex n=1 Tax=Darwinula stevensoni TaxID=69355 RepID=A0A7R9FSC8_9CRUS|nr:unnamed protein product [Darwinula stevensoni]CAG0903276.1 unnamed protein product [Darwinula stevensoni]